MDNEFSGLRRWLWRILIYSALFVVLAGFYFILAYATKLVFQEASVRYIIAAIITILVTVLLLSPLNSFYQSMLNRDFGEVEESAPSLPVQHPVSLESLIVKLSRATTLEALTLDLISNLKREKELTFCAFALFSELDKLVRFDFVKFDGDARYEPFFRKLAFSKIEQFNQPVLARDDENGLDLPSAILMKLNLGEKERGLLCLGPREDRLPFLHEELTEVQILSEPLTVMLGNTLRIKEYEEKINGLQESCNQLRRGREELQLINQHVVKMAEAERNHSAQELQADSLQKLQQIINLYDRFDSNISEREEQILHLAIAAEKSLSYQIRRLRPASLDKEGLPEAIRGMVNDIQQKVKLAVRLNISENLNNKRLQSDLELGLYRVAQEALQNVLKHSNAHHVTITLSYSEENETVRLVVLDDGIGFDPPSMLSKNGRQDHLGLAGMEERITSIGGRFEIRSSPGAGALVEAEVPLKAALTPQLRS
ncbi:MAG TPA: ATP-binding protein [Chloroflexia bacterium]|nr:ATP-binding protein [Chloroflexia bacterium]